MAGVGEWVAGENSGGSLQVVVVVVGEEWGELHAVVAAAVGPGQVASASLRDVEEHEVHIEIQAEGAGAV